MIIKKTPVRAEDRDLVVSTVCSTSGMFSSIIFSSGMHVVSPHMSVGGYFIDRTEMLDYSEEEALATHEKMVRTARVEPIISNHYTEE